jgi:putative hydrolase of the HAD superfamily
MKEGNNSKIKNIVFDFGDVFVNLDKNATKRKLEKLGFDDFDSEMVKMNELYETGKIKTAEFLEFYYSKTPNSSKKELKKAWNSIILDLPEYRIQFLEKTAKKYKVYLLSNINDLHLEYIKKMLGNDMYHRFISVFDKVFYSHLIQFRKPNNEPFQFVIDTVCINPIETIFIDDTKENCYTAKNMGFNVWHINPDLEDVINLNKYI